MAALEGNASRGVETLSLSTRRDLVRNLKTLEAGFEAAANQRRIDYDRVFESHNAFHERLVGATAGPRHRALIETVRPQVDRYEWVYAPLVGPDYSATFAEHAAIIRAVRDGSPDQTERAVVANWNLGAARLSVVIGKAGSRGDWLAAK